MFRSTNKLTARNRIRALMDFVFVIDNVSQMYITGPEVIKQVTGQFAIQWN
ncbi:hypothetical protein I5Q83_02920 [Enterocloster clostridioformis]|nr:hypothetical protein [Enterocloster clostridioformis]QQR04225.1 hypothetical protein I5Q83_02920 [Enterocloster clostridioformis]